MGIVSEEVFTGWYKSLLKSEIPYRLPYQMVSGDVPLAKDASVLYAQIRQFVIDGGTLGKRMRPWEINANLMKGVDRSEAWWGWEFETGWNTAEALSQVVEFSWDNFDGVTFDGEGEGAHPVEITFIPEVQSSFDAGTSQAQRFMRWVDDNASLVNNTHHIYIGTHLNLSIPEITDFPDAEAARSFVNRMLQWTGATKGDRQWLFGREQLYGLAYTQGSETTGVWLELKTFRTPYTCEMFDRFCRVATVITDQLRGFFRLSEEERNKFLSSDMGVSNLRDIVEHGLEAVTRPMIELVDLQDKDARPFYHGPGRDFY